jgi:hypothetical protein
VHIRVASESQTKYAESNTLKTHQGQIKAPALNICNTILYVIIFWGYCRDRGTFPEMFRLCVNRECDANSEMQTGLCVCELRQCKCLLWSTLFCYKDKQRHAAPSRPMNTYAIFDHEQFHYGRSSSCMGQDHNHNTINLPISQIIWQNRRIDHWGWRFPTNAQSSLQLRRPELGGVEICSSKYATLGD